MPRADSSTGVKVAEKHAGMHCLADTLLTACHLLADLKVMLQHLRSPGGSVSVMPEGIAGARARAPPFPPLAIMTGVLPSGVVR